MFVQIASADSEQDYVRTLILRHVSKKHHLHVSSKIANLLNFNCVRRRRTNTNQGRGGQIQKSSCGCVRPFGSPRVFFFRGLFLLRKRYALLYALRCSPSVLCIAGKIACCGVLDQPCGISMDSDLYFPCSSRLNL